MFFWLRLQDSSYTLFSCCFSTSFVFIFTRYGNFSEKNLFFFSFMSCTLFVNNQKRRPCVLESLLATGRRYRVPPLWTSHAQRSFLPFPIAKQIICQIVAKDSKRISKSIRKGGKKGQRKNFLFQAAFGSRLHCYFEGNEPER